MAEPGTDRLSGPRISARDLDVMRHTAVDIRQDITETGEDPVIEDVCTLARYVVELVDEVDVLMWRITAASMALDGRLQPDEVRLG